MSTARAVVGIDGKPTVVDIEVGEPGPGEVLVDLKASGLNVDDETFAKAAVEQAGVATIAVSAFAEENSSRHLVRLCFAKRDATLEQVHGRSVVVVDAANADAMRAAPRCADALVTRAHDIALAIRIADCVPVLLAARDVDAIGAAHAGWRGLAAGVLEATVAAMNAPPSSVVAWLGPAIGPAAFSSSPRPMHSPELWPVHGIPPTSGRPPTGAVLPSSGAVPPNSGEFGTMSGTQMLVNWSSISPPAQAEIDGAELPEVGTANIATAGAAAIATANPPARISRRVGRWKVAIVTLSFVCWLCCPGNG